MDHVMCAVAARLGPRAGRLGSLGHIGFRRGGNRQSGNSDGGSCQGGNPHRGGSRRGREPGVHPSFSRGSPTGSSARHRDGSVCVGARWDNRYTGCGPSGCAQRGGQTTESRMWQKEHQRALRRGRSGGQAEAPATAPWPR